MAIKPEELITPNGVILTPEELAEVEKHEARIDAKLKKQFLSPEQEVCVYVGRASERIRLEIIRRYKIAGWSSVERHNNSLKMKV